ncbi:MAG TPA: PEP-CTERM sorting domain-containing protein [Rhodopila sp.]|nr:PEP-CTERM sorting domain-containing protein [Rhodopila sp.]
MAMAAIRCGCTRSLFFHYISIWHNDCLIASPYVRKSRIECRRGMMTKALLAAAAVLGISGLMASAQAETLGGPGVYYGTGNSDNPNWTVTGDTSTFQLGLEALIRYQGSVAPTTAGVYNVGLGNTLEPGKSGSLWGFAFSAYDPAGIGNVKLSLSITDYFQDITVTGDPMLIPDNATDGTIGIQNSEALSYPQFDALYNSAINDTFLITLSASDLNGVSLGDVSIQVNAGAGAPLPEPFSLSLMGAGLIGLGAARRRRKSAAR